MQALSVQGRRESGRTHGGAMNGPRRVLRFREARGGAFPTELAHALGCHINAAGSDSTDGTACAVIDFFAGCSITVTEKTTPGTTDLRLVITFEYPQPERSHGAEDEEVR